MQVRALLSFFTVCLLFGCSNEPKNPSKIDLSSNKPPNIILILADDLSPPTLGIYGQKIIKTPHLDSMAREGAMFTRGYSAGTSCAPSRLAILLGRHLGNIDRKGNSDENRLLESDICFPELLRASGYRTAMFGKQHGAHYRNWFGMYTQIVGDIPSDHGFEEFVGTLSSVEAHQFYLDGVTNPSAKNPKHLWQDQNGRISKYNIEPHRYTQNEYIDLALNFIDEKKEEPFFLYLPLQSPHFEQVVPIKGEKDFKESDVGLLEQYLDSTGTSIFNETPYLGTLSINMRHNLTPLATFAALISRLDRDVGLIKNKVSSLGLKENTIIIFTADNGFGGWPYGSNEVFQPKGKLRAAKGSTYEGGIRVPFIVWGHDVASGSVVDKPVIGYDLAPTILDYARINKPFSTDGISLKLTFSNNSSQENRPFLYWESLRKQSQAILFSDKFKLLKYQDSNGSDKIEAYNILEDEAESIDLSESIEIKQILTKANNIFKKEWQMPNEL